MAAPASAPAAVTAASAAERDRICCTTGSRSVAAVARLQEEADLDMVLRGLGVVPPSARKHQVELQPVEDTVEAWIIGRLQKFDIFGDRRESHRKSEVTRCFLYA